MRERSIRILPGQYYDAETGLHYNYYKSLTGQLLPFVVAAESSVKEGLNKSL